MSQLGIEIVPVTPVEQNCTLMWDEGSRVGVVIDPGGDVARILARVSALGLVIERVLLTHGHVDHAGGASALREALPGGVPIEGPGEADRFLLGSLAEDARRFGIMDARAVVPDRFLVEGDQVALGPHTLDVLHVPGHTPGHIVFVERRARLAQLGDTLLHGSIGRTDLPYGDHDALLLGIRTKLLPLGDDLRFVCGHGPESTIGDERRDNPFLRG